MMDTIVQWILNWVADNPNMAVLFTLMAVARAVFKPICSVIQIYVDATPSDSDNKKWLEIQEGKYFKAVAYAMDYFLSIKIPVKK